MGNVFNGVPNETSQDTKCPSCGGTLSFDPATGGLVCNFCGNHVELKTTVADRSAGYTLEDLQHNGGRRIQYGVKRIICGTCGGSLLRIEFDNRIHGDCRSP